MAFDIDDRLVASSVWLGDLPLSQWRFKNQKHYPWCILIPRVPQVSEWYELSHEQQAQLCQEITQVSLAMKKIFALDKLNVASLGNVVRQLHIHIVGRSAYDPLWPQGIWQEAQIESPYPSDEFQSLATKLQSELSSLF